MTREDDITPLFAPANAGSRIEQRYREPKPLLARTLLGYLVLLLKIIQLGFGLWARFTGIEVADAMAATLSNGA